MNALVASWFSTDELITLYQPEALVYLLVVLALLMVGKLSYGLLMRVKLTDELAKRDNKALALSLSAYTLGVAFVLWGVLTADGLPSIAHDIVDLCLSGLAGIALLHLGRIATDKVVFPGFSTRKAVIDGNIGVAAAEAGNALGTGLIVMRALSLDGMSEAERLLDGAIFFVAAQAAFMLFAIVYQKLTRFDLVAEIQGGNPAAGIALGLTLAAQGLLLSYAIHQTASLVVFGAWFLFSTTLLLGLRKFVDWVLLPGHALDDEISKDRNWGVALVEGMLALSTALLLTGSF